jgi:hypothetical protein
VVQEAERFEPDEEEISSARSRSAAPTGPVKLRTAAAALRNPHFIDELKTVLEHHKGDAPVFLAIVDGDGKTREVQLGDEFRVRHSNGLIAELEPILGSDALAA